MNQPGQVPAGPVSRLPSSVVTVNGGPEARRGRQPHRGDGVAVGEQAVRVV